MTATGGQPHEVVISGLSPNTHYYYRMVYDGDGDVGDDFETRTQHSFWTQRALGARVHVHHHLRFARQHPTPGSGTTWTQTMNNVNANHPDFQIDLGDTFAMDSVRQRLRGRRTPTLCQRQYFDLVGHSAPIFLAVGNHESKRAGTWTTRYGTRPAACSWARTPSKHFFPNPVPDAFYSGNADPYAFADDGDHLHEDYYAWTWGDALFVVIDPYRYTMTARPGGNTAAGAGWRGLR